MSVWGRRTRIITGRKLQVRYVIQILLFIILAVTITGYTVYYTVWMMLGEKLARVYPQGLLLGVMGEVNRTMLFRVLLLLPLVILGGIALSSRIAGPIYRIQLFLKKVTGGNYNAHLRLRRSDEMHDLADSLNSFVSALKSKEESFNKGLGDIDSEVSELEINVRSGSSDPDMILKKIKAVKETVGRTKSS